MTDVASSEATVSFAPILVPIPTAASMVGRGVTFIYGAIADGRIDLQRRWMRDDGSRDEHGSENQAGRAGG